MRASVGPWQAWQALRSSAYRPVAFPFSSFSMFQVGTYSASGTIYTLARCKVARRSRPPRVPSHSRQRPTLRLYVRARPLAAHTHPLHDCDGPVAAGLVCHLCPGRRLAPCCAQPPSHLAIELRELAGGPAAADRRRQAYSGKRPARNCRGVGPFRSGSRATLVAGAIAPASVGVRYIPPPARRQAAPRAGAMTLAMAPADDSILAAQDAASPTAPFARLQGRHHGASTRAIARGYSMRNAKNGFGGRPSFQDPEACH